MLKILYETIFSKKALFSEETAKNHSGGAFDHFSGKGSFVGRYNFEIIILIFYLSLKNYASMDK